MHFLYRSQNFHWNYANVIMYINLYKNFKKINDMHLKAWEFYNFLKEMVHYAYFYNIMLFKYNLKIYKKNLLQRIHLSKGSYKQEIKFHFLQQKKQQLLNRLQYLHISFSHAMILDRDPRMHTTKNQQQRKLLRITCSGTAYEFMKQILYF